MLCHQYCHPCDGCENVPYGPHLPGREQAAGTGSPPRSFLALVPGSVPHRLLLPVTERGRAAFLGDTRCSTASACSKTWPQTCGALCGPLSGPFCSPPFHFFVLLLSSSVFPAHCLASRRFSSQFLFQVFCLLIASCVLSLSSLWLSEDPVMQDVKQNFQGKLGPRRGLVLVFSWVSTLRASGQEALRCFSPSAWCCFPCC